ncbi:hypothetical protein GMA11_08065 [Granulicatella sp. zg-ZJ]|uniref:hypothetical protein n=1 Tax=unclassified Granulicatella TaxID=2630493 RepID=UPI0013BEE50D|nr:MULTISPECIES: hypothetical protein [unclassified Granulicatella]MBS4751158.1 hypothetical protein [Carnobacteriaceae bacterium zg-ZUI78]NEW63333.1 hypothetical protein [Granulicatella sp. zg-ZJ]NEW66932.1 hypothetical protein [Granulicatella sp. zg-84]QMI85893.1 hypothetical protein H1220_00530 [Carnobacteriaceae bacterium zg-84]
MNKYNFFTKTIIILVVNFILEGFFQFVKNSSPLPVLTKIVTNILLIQDVLNICVYILLVSCFIFEYCYRKLIKDTIKNSLKSLAATIRIKNYCRFLTSSKSLNHNIPQSSQDKIYSIANRVRSTIQIEYFNQQAIFTISLNVPMQVEEIWKSNFQKIKEKLHQLDTDYTFSDITLIEPLTATYGATGTKITNKEDVAHC